MPLKDLGTGHFIGDLLLRQAMPQNGCQKLRTQNWEAKRLGSEKRCQKLGSQEVKRPIRSGQVRFWFQVCCQAGALLEVASDIRPKTLIWSLWISAFLFGFQ